MPDILQNLPNRRFGRRRNDDGSITVILPTGDEVAIGTPSLAVSGAFTVADTGHSVFHVTTGASSFTGTLPTLADNLNREITVIKVDSGAGVVTVDGEGAETISGVASITLDSDGDYAVLRATASEWKLIGYLCHGSNANGEYVRLSDGTQICWDSASVASNASASNLFGTTSGTTYYKASTAETFAKAFAAAPVVVVTCTNTAVGYFAKSRDISTTGFNILSISGADSGGTVQWNFIAIGRWK